MTVHWGIGSYELWGDIKCRRKFRCRCSYRKNHFSDWLYPVLLCHVSWNLYHKQLANRRCYTNWSNRITSTPRSIISVLSREALLKNIILEDYLRNVFVESILQRNMTAVSETFQVCGIVPLFRNDLEEWPFQLRISAASNVAILGIIHSGHL